LLIMIDNYDSFTYILVQYFRQLGVEVEVYRNDAITIRKLEKLAPAGLVISPGPGNPDSAGMTLPVIEHFAGKVPLLGVCLGHQAIGQTFGGKVIRADRLMHGKTSPICHDGEGLFAGMLQPFMATRYHSLILDPLSQPTCLKITAWTDQGEIMGIRHQTLPLVGIQFHPESILTEKGLIILKNFVVDYAITTTKEVPNNAAIY
jgi:anthranilate synthase/aminodeoxychorismate synthase-like glutamine amidotransferase